MPFSILEYLLHSCISASDSPQITFLTLCSSRIFCMSHVFYRRPSFPCMLSSCALLDSAEGAGTTREAVAGNLSNCSSRVCKYGTGGLSRKYISLIAARKSCRDGTSEHSGWFNRSWKIVGEIICRGTVSCSRSQVLNTNRIKNYSTRTPTDGAIHFGFGSPYGHNRIAGSRFEDSWYKT